MKVKFFFIIVLFLIVNTFINSSETRLKGMSGISKLGLYVIPDLWCDSFFVNPAYATDENERLIINYYNDFIFSFNGHREDTDYETYSVNEEIKGYTIYPEFSLGFLLPIKNFTIGSNISFNIYYNEREEISHIDDIVSITDTEETTKENDHYFQSDLLFSWKIRDFINIGFTLGVDTVLYSNYEWLSNSDEENKLTEVETNTENSRLGKKPQDLSIKSSFGLYIKKDYFKISFATPFVLNIKNNYPSSSYDEDAEDWEYYEDSFYINNKIKSVLEFYVSKLFTFRIPIELCYKYTYLKREYGDEDDFDGLNGDEFYLSKQHYIPIKVAFSINNQINKKFFLFYGSDLSLSLSYYFDYYENETDYDFDQQYVNLDFGLFFGGEFTILKWLILRFGMSTYFFRYSYSKAYSTENEFEIILNTSFNSGIAFKPKDWFSIEINTNFLTTGLDNSKKVQDTDYFDHESSILNSNFTFEFDFGIVFNIDYRKKKKKSIHKEKINENNKKK